MERLTVALVGAGRMGDLRAPILYANPRIDFVCVVEFDQVKGEQLAKKFNCKYYHSITAAKSELLALNSIVLCTPTFTHSGAIQEAASLGLHIFTEKPIAEDAKEIQLNYKVCRENNVTLCCGFQRRFDKSYIDLRNTVVSGKIGSPKMIHVFFADHPAPPLEFLKHSGDPFMDLSVHDVDFIRWILGSAAPLEVLGTGSSSSAELEACGVLDNATMYIKFQGGVTCNIMMSRGSTYGYDQRCEVYGDKGIASISSINETSLRVGDNTGFHQAPLQYSFPQCFREAFELEIETFVTTLLTQSPWPISEEDCVLAQLIASSAKESCRLGKMIPFQAQGVLSPTSELTSITLRPIGNGNFAKHMLGVLASHDDKHELFKALPPYSPSSALSYETDVLGDSSVQAVYVCSPDTLHHTQAGECLQAGKHVLVEKPVYHFDDLMDTYDKMLLSTTTCITGSGGTDTDISSDIGSGCGSGTSRRTPVTPVLMVGFHRRFDTEFLRAKKACATQIPSTIVIESRDPVPADSDLPFVLRNSMCHDVDLVHWLLSGDHTGSDSDSDSYSTAVSIEFISCTTDVRTSHIELTGCATVTATSTEGVLPKHVDLKIIYCKENKSYVQKCILDGVIYGYDFQPPEGAANPYFIYQSAYAAQWECFSRLIRDVECNGCESGQRQRDRARWEGYRDTFASLAQAEDLLRQSM